MGRVIIHMKGGEGGYRGDGKMGGKGINLLGHHLQGEALGVFVVLG